MLGLWFIVIICSIVGFNLYNAHQKSEQGLQFEATALPFVKQVIPVISEWDPKKIRQLLAPEFLETNPEDRFNRAILFFSKLGPLQSAEEPRFNEVVTKETAGEEAKRYVTYIVDAQYTNGDAEIQIQLIDRGDHFQLYNFTLRSEFLLPE